MKVKDIRKALETLPQEAEFLVSQDEELNVIFRDFEIGILDDDKYVIYGLSGSEEE